MKKSFSKIITYIFVVLLILPTLAWGIILLIPEAEAYFNRDIGENRQLAVVSEEVSLSELTSEWEAYYSDHAPFRKMLILANQKINGVIEKDYMSSVQPFLLQCFYGKNENVETLELYIQEEEDIAVETETVETMQSVEAQMKEHNYTAIESGEPTCTEEGYIMYVCSDCGAEYKESITANGHEEVIVENVEASYLSYGHKIYQCINCAECRWADFEAKLVDTSYFPQVIHNNLVIQGRYNWLFYRGDNSVGYYRGTNVFSEEEMQEKLALMQQLQDVCDAKGIELVFMVMPNKEQVYPEYMPTYESVAERKRLDIFADYVKENSSIKFLYPLEELKAGKVYYDTYYVYDTHWNNVGAYIGTMSLCEALGLETTSIADIITRRYEDVLVGLCISGDLDPAAYPPDYDVTFEHKPEIKVLKSEGLTSPKYGYDTVHKAETNSPNQCNFVMLGDSFRVSMIPYLEKEFSNSTFVQRQDCDQVKTEIQNADVLVISAVERFDEDIFVRIPTIISYLSE